MTRASCVQSAVCKLFHHGREHAGRNRQIVRRPRRVIQLRAQPQERRRIRVVTIDVAQMLDQRRERGRIRRRHHIR